MPDAVALRWRDSSGHQHLTWSEYAARACRLAASLRDLGVRPGERVVLMMTNRPEFYVADVAVLLAGATPVSIYNSSSPEQIAYIVDHCEAAVAIVGDGGQYERVRAACPGAVLQFDNVHDLPGTESLELEPAAAAVRPMDLLTLIYTSGTTGPPKAVALSHANICWLMESWARAMGTARGSGSMTGWRMVSYLPMAHIAERLFSYYLHMAHGTDVTTCPDPTLVNEYLLAVQPHCFFGPPRAWEKFHATIRVSDPDRAERVEKLDEEDKRALRALIGLPDCRMALTGAAPMQPDVHRFILDIGIPLSEIYGLSECTGPMTWSPHDVRPGTVGRPFPARRCAWPTTARSSPAAVTSSTAISRTRSAPPRCSMPTDGCTPATSASSPRTVTCASSTGRRN
jgi:long-chain acyl-CoA synthetase